MDTIPQIPRGIQVVPGCLRVDQGIWGAAVYFDGVDDYLLIDHAPEFAPSDAQLTISLWVPPPMTSIKVIGRNF